MFTDSVVPLEWDESLEQYVPKAGVIQRFRSEGWADTLVGQHGLTVKGEEIFNSPGPKFVLWGDSYAEAVQVPDASRAVNLFNSMSDSLKGFTVAAGGRGCADYFFDIPRYEKIADGIKGHVVLLTDMDDAVPGAQLAGRSRFCSNPWRFEESPRKPSQLSLRWAPLVNSLRFDFVHDLYRRLNDFRIQWIGGPQKAQAESVASHSLDHLAEGWAFMLESYKARTKGFLIFIYVPPGPQPSESRLPSANPQLPLVQEFSKACNEAGVGFVDLSQPFYDLYYKKGLLARGFFNSPPGVGHLNKEGHRLVAEGLYRYIVRNGL